MMFYQAVMHFATLIWTGSSSEKTNGSTSYRAFGTELGRDATPLEADLPRFIDLNKEFNGKAEMQAKGVRSKCVTLLIDGPDDADPWGREALYNGDERVGRLTSGGYSVHFGKSIGMGYVTPDLAKAGTRLKVKMLEAALRKAKYNQKKAARILGLTYHQFRGLYRQYKKVN